MFKFNHALHALHARTQRLAQNAHYALLATLLGVLSPAAHAQSFDWTANFVTGMCKFIGPLIGTNSKFAGILLIVSGLIAVGLWFMQENKEGVVLWVIRAAIFAAVIIGIANLPTLFGMTSPCSSSTVI